MTVSSYYSVFTISDISKMTSRFARTGSVRIVHHFECTDFDYYVMCDNSGNHTDFIQFKNKTMPSAFFAIRINVDDFEKMSSILEQSKYKLSLLPVNNEKMKLGIFLSTDNEPNVVLFQHNP